MHDVARPETMNAKVKSRRGMILKAALAVFALFLLLAGIKALQIKKMMSSKPPMPVETVTSATVKEENWAPTFSAVGSISPVQGAMVSTELPGVVSEIDFKNGGEAKKGEQLMQLDASSEEAQLQSAEADLALAKADWERAQDLASRKVISKAELDAAESKFKQKSATVDQMRSMITKKTVRAPFDGQLGIREVNVGQMINAGQQVVALTALDRVYIDFALPQQDLARLSTGLDVTVHTDALPGKEFHGKLTAINPMVDTATRNVTLQGTLGKSRACFETRDVCESRRCSTGETQDPCDSGHSCFLRAVWRFGFHDREEERSENGQGIANNPAAVCAHRRIARRFCCGYGGIEGRPDHCWHWRFQIAQRHGRDDQ